MGWINKIGDSVKTLFNQGRKPTPPLPAPLLAPESQSRPGLSAISLTSAVIQRLPEIGIETGANPDGSLNKNNLFVQILCEELIKEIKNNAKISVVITPGSVVGVGSGSNAGGPVVTAVINTNLSTLNGIME